MSESKHIHQMENGLVVLAEEIPTGEAVSYSLWVPCGTVDDPVDRPGLTGLVSEMVVRGAGDYDNRGLVYAFENLGADSSESVSQSHSSFSAALLADNVGDALSLTADVIRRPHFPEEELEPSRQVLLQEIAGMEDEPSRKMMIELGLVFFPAPWGRPGFGTVEGLTAATLDDIQNYYRKGYSPDGAILSATGKIDWPAFRGRVEELFGDWTGRKRPKPIETESKILTKHIPFESTQTHIGLAWPSAAVGDPDYLLQKSAVGVLSGGMSCRLFTEVREKRGLCYSVYASYYSNKDRGSVFCYCGSGNDTAQEALDVIIAELDRLSERGISQEELDRLKIRSKSGIVMAQESTAARAALMARDWFYLGRVRSLKEILDNIDRLDLDEINAKIREKPFGPLRLVTLGPEPLNIDRSLLG